MALIERFLANHVLANILFVLVLVVGIVAYSQLPRARDPEINFNWVNISTVLPGASSLEVEKRLTDPLEDAIGSGVRDIKFVSSTSRESVSNILVRFEDISQKEFDKRMTDLRREVQNAYNDKLPTEAIEPDIREITTSNGFPTATVVLTTDSFDDNFRRYAEVTRKEMERIPGIDKIDRLGVEEPELHVAFHPEKMVGLGLSPTDIADTVRGYFRDRSIGDIATADNKWTLRFEGTSGSMEDLAKMPVVSSDGIVSLGTVATLYRSQEEAKTLASFGGKPAVMFSITKTQDANTLELLDQLSAFIANENSTNKDLGYDLILTDDQSVSTREAIDLMQNNAIIGLALVMLVAWLFLGTRIAILTCIGIPFTLAGTFFVIHTAGLATLNNSVLLGVVIALGMLVDDAVVVVESIYYRMERGMKAMTAALDALKEVAAPVVTSVLTTVAVFLPLMLLPGIVGDFMRVIPMVVTLSLLISLLEAFWMLPAHVSMLKVSYGKRSRVQEMRTRLTRRVRHFYSLALLRSMRHPGKSLAAIGMVGMVALILLFSGALKLNFFASDPYRVFYVGVEMPAGTTLDKTLAVATELEAKTLKLLRPNEVRSTTALAGQRFTAAEPLFGDHLGQVMVSLEPHIPGQRDVREIIAAVEAGLSDKLRGGRVSTLVLEDGPPTGQAVNLKVRGDDFAEIQQVVADISHYMTTSGLYKNINLDFSPGNPQALITLDGDAIQRAGINPEILTRTLQAYVDGEVVTSYQDRGEEVDVRVKAHGANGLDHIEELFDQVIYSPEGQAIPLGELIDAEYDYGLQNIRHFNYLRTITLAADFDESRSNTVAANALIEAYWQSIAAKYPTIDVDFSGELDDIEESLDSILLLFGIGIGLIYLILGTQFASYWQPLLVLLAVPLAFIGVVFGLTLTANPLSLYTLYGVVALSGISVNSAIVLIAAANDRIASGMSVLHATIYAARRRVIPILITSLTTIAGLFSLAAGIGGKSLVWGPVATAIVSGLIFSTALTLIVIPLFYRFIQSSKLITRQRERQLAERSA